jgi:hypothetical protein
MEERRDETPRYQSKEAARNQQELIVHHIDRAEFAANSYLQSGSRWLYNREDMPVFVSVLQKVTFKIRRAIIVDLQI